MRRGLSALAALFLVAHLATLPSGFDDIDGYNFGLGVRDFDVAQHQPHPPGYPLFIALGKIATRAFRLVAMPAPEVRGLAVWSALGGAALVLLIAALWRTVDGDRSRAAAAAVVTACCPLFWFTALRPLSDVPGLCLAIAALGLAVRALPAGWTGGRAPAPRALVAGAFIAGLAVGVRSQTAVITGPLLLLAIAAPQSGVPARLRVGALVAGSTGVALWAIPLLVQSGGLAGYLAALGSQAGEDFSGVVMLWTNRTVRVAAFAALHTFVLPWDSPALAGVMLALAGAGFWILVRRSPRRAALLGVMFIPYAVFHVLFQETVTVRYALPLVLPVCYLAAVAVMAARPAAAGFATAAIAAVCLWLAVPAGVAYARNASPIEAALSGMRATLPAASVTGIHRRIWTESRRARRWLGEPPGRLLPAPRDYEWLQLTQAWRERDADPSQFLADPRRTDLALIDPLSQRRQEYRWPFNGATYVGGARPDLVDVVTITRPGWFLERGWALTPEVAGITDRDGTGPPGHQAAGWIRRRPGEAVMMFGGRHLGGTTEHAAIRVSIDDRPILTFDAAPGPFLEFVTLPAGTLAGAGTFAKLTAGAAAAGNAPVRVAFEQFGLQDPGVAQLGFGSGWHEPEYSVETGRSWRWMGERADLVLHPGTGDVVLRIAGESPLRYFRQPSHLAVSVGSRTLARVDVSDDFGFEVTLPARELAAANGRVTLTSDQMFVPGDRTGSADRRHLALRLYSVAVVTK